MIRKHSFMGKTYKVLPFFDLKGKKLYYKSINTKVSANQLTDCFTADLPLGMPAVYLRFSLSEGNTILSQNEYWKSNQEGGGFEEFNDLAEIRLKAKVEKQQSGIVTFVVSNSDKLPAIGLKFNLRDLKSGKIILPANFSDGYFALLPGEKKRIVVEWNDTKLIKPEVITEAYNLKAQSLFAIK